MGMYSSSSVIVYMVPFLKLVLSVGLELNLRRFEAATHT